MAKSQTPTTVNIGGLEITMFSGSIRRVTETRENGITCEFCKDGPFRQEAVVRVTRDQIVFNSDMKDACVLHVIDAIDRVNGDRSHLAQYYR